jgi:methylmalonyl-CoA/ethylmalonyl-CoA epimerase
MEAFENEVRLHHAGFVVESIGKSAAAFAESLGMVWDQRIIHDPAQTVRVSFLYPGPPGNPTIELVEPEGTESAVARFLRRGGGLHHLCYEVDSIEKQLEWTRARRDLIIRAPTPAVAFEGRRIAWVYTKNKLLLEYLERCRK